jgi:predicted PurR-regulated permease PerM
MAEHLGDRDNFQIRRATFFVLLILVTFAFIGLISDFLMACFWAAILAIVFHGTNEWLLTKFPGRRNLATTLTLVIVLFIAVIPIFLITVAVINESQNLYQAFESGEMKVLPIDKVRELLPQIEEVLSKVGITAGDFESRLKEIGQNIVAGFGEIAVRYTQNAINVFIQFTLMMYILFFFIRDGRQIVEAIQRALPIGDEIEELLFRRFAQVSRATLKGTLVVATIQGSIGGITFAILGIPAAVLWGVLMILLSLLPIGGSAIIWAPTAVVLFVQGHVTKAIILVIIGALFIGLIDNILRPRLVSRDTRMPDYLVLLATLGGLAFFGLTGFIIGPVIAALFTTCWEITGRLFGGRAR